VHDRLRIRPAYAARRRPSTDPHGPDVEVLVDYYLMALTVDRVYGGKIR
jgi:hypothetical protein